MPTARVGNCKKVRPQMANQNITFCWDYQTLFSLCMHKLLYTQVVLHMFSQYFKEHKTKGCHLARSWENLHHFILYFLTFIKWKNSLEFFNVLAKGTQEEGIAQIIWYETHVSFTQEHRILITLSWMTAFSTLAKCPVCHFANFDTKMCKPASFFRHFMHDSQNRKKLLAWNGSKGLK